MLKIIKDERATDETTHGEKGSETVDSVAAIDPRPRPATHVRHLDVNKVLERSLPLVEDASKKFSRD